MKIFERKNIKYTVLFLLTIVAFVMMLFPKSGETFGFISQFLNLIVGWVFSLFPFSVLTIFILLIPVYVGLVVWRIVVNAKRKTMKKFWFNFLCVACILFVWFSFILGLNYRKASVYDKMNFAQAELTNENVIAASDYLIKKLNDSARSVDFDGPNRALVLPADYDKTKIEDIVNHAIAKQNLQFLYGFASKPKYTFIPNLLGVMGFDGVYFPFFAELNIDSSVSDGNLGVLLTHELMHAKGILNEEEAEFLAQYICVHSDDAILRYSGSYTATVALLQLIDGDNLQRQLDKIEDVFLRMRISYVVGKNSYYNASWFESISNFFYDVYLKLNYVDGVSAYDNDVRGWVRFAKTVAR